MKKNLIFTLGAIFTLSLGLSACSKPPQTEAAAKPQAQHLSHLNIGYQKAALKLIVAKKNHFFEAEFPNTQIEWKEFPAGPQTLEALSVGSIDVGYTGDAPVVFALSAGKQLNYLGYEQSSRRAHALLLPTDSPLKRIEELKGKRIALTKGSSAHTFLAETLQQAKLSWNDIQPIWLTPSDARAALDKKAIDAWAVWEPFISATEINGKARILFESTHLSPAYSYYLAHPNFIQQHAESAKKVLKVLNQTDQWINSHPAETAQILAESTGLDLKIAQQVIEKKPNPNPVAVLNADVIQSQQNIAKLFYDLKLIPNDIDAAKFAWKYPHP
jgi:sulfonate transport system substrate-binding protein